MPWFRVDDGFYDHPRIEQLPNASIGLWVKAGSWCAKHLTNGVIPASVVRRMKGTPSQVGGLIRCGLWVETSTESGAKAYAFRDWVDYQIERREVLEKRAEWALKKRESRNRKRANQSKGENVPLGLPQSVPGGVPGGQVENVPGGVLEPFPSIPFHSKKGVGVTGEVTTERADVLPPSFSLVDPADARCAAHAGLPRDQVPACGACRDARLAAEQAAKAAKRSAREAIAGCQWCDDTGHISRTVDGVVHVKRCDHQGLPRFDESAPGGFTPASNPHARQEALKRLK